MNFAPYSDRVRKIMADPVKKAFFQIAMAQAGKGLIDAFSIPIDGTDHTFTSKPHILEGKLERNERIKVLYFEDDRQSQ